MTAAAFSKSSTLTPASACRAQIHAHICIAALCCALILGKSEAADRQPAEAAPLACNLRVEPQPLDAALQELARQCGVQLIYFSEITEGRRAPAIKGRFAIDTALQHVLNGTGLIFRRIGPQTIQVERSPETNVAAASKRAADKAPAQAGRLSEAADDKSPPEIVIAATAQGLVATRAETPLSQIAQTISIISPEQIRQQNNTTLADALSDAVGITAYQVDSANQSFFARGFQITTYHLDGGVALREFPYQVNYIAPAALIMTPDLGEFDHIEVLRGSDALFGASGNPGAAVNLVRKRPLDTFEVTTHSLAGSWDHYRQEVDLTGPLGLGGGLRGRLDAVLDDRHYFYDGADLEHKNVFGVLEYDVGPRTLLTLGGSYQRNDGRPFEAGLPSFADGSDAHLPRGTAFTFPWERLYTQNREVYLRLEHRFGAAWRVKLAATSLNGSADYTLANFQSQVDRSTGTLPYAPYSVYTVWPTLQKQLSVDLTVTDSADWLGHRESIAFGADYTRFSQDSLTQVIGSFGPGGASAYNFDPAPYPNPRLLPGPLAFGYQVETVQTGLWASGMLQISAPWSVTAGVRISNERTSNSYYFDIFGLISPSDTSAYSYVGKLTPYVGTMFTLTSHYSLYASYSDIYDTNGGHINVKGARLPPADGVDIEGGVKASWRSGALTGTLVGYTILQRGLGTFDYSSTPEEQRPYCCYTPNGRNRGKGIDLELAGTVAPGWLVSAGYSFNNNVSYTTRLDGTSMSPSPWHLLKIWTSAQLPGRWYQWNLGVTLQAQSANSNYGVSCPLQNGAGYCVGPFQSVKESQGSYAIVSPRIGYQIDASWQIALSVTNLFDRIYYQSVGGPQNGNWYGDPRSFMVRVDGRF